MANNKEIYSSPEDRRLSVEQFIGGFRNLRPKELLLLSSFPTKPQAQQLASLNQEILLVKTKQNQLYIAKGETEEGTGISFDAISQLDPDEVIHTQPFSGDVNEVLLRDKLKTVLPSPADLIQPRSTVETFKIWSPFGTTIYQPCENPSHLQNRLILFAYRTAILRVRQTDSQTFEEYLTAMSGEIEAKFNANFKFKEWESIISS